MNVDIDEYETGTYGMEDACVQVILFPAINDTMLSMPILMHKKTREILLKCDPKILGYQLSESYDVPSQKIFDALKDRQNKLDH